MSRVLFLALAGASATTAVSATAYGADPTLEECVAANERSGPLRVAGKLREARANLLKCSASSCPAAVRDDCISGATKLEDAVPTVVFAAVDRSGADVAAVSVSMDGQPLAPKLDGSALEVDPGEHLFTFTAPGVPPAEKRLVIREAEKNRREKVILEVGAPPPAIVGPTAAPPPRAAADGAPAPSTWSSQKTIAIVVGAVGLVAVGVGSGFGLAAHGAWNQAQSDCGGSCSATSTAQSEADHAHQDATIANIAVIGGAAAVVGGIVLWVVAPSHPASTSARLTPLVGPGSAGLAASGSW